MMRRLFAATLATAFVAAVIAPPASAEETTPVKQITPQQQKMKDCAVKWKDEKAKTEATARETYSKFMSGCLKK